MTLDQYLSQPGNSAAALADRAKTSVASINRILHGEQKPSVSMIRAIVEAAEGAITTDDLIYGAPRRRAKRKAAA